MLEALSLEGMPYTRSACAVLLGEYPPENQIADWACAELFVLAWDGRKFEGDTATERLACLALCEVGLLWDGDHPYNFSLIAERLRELMPELGATDIDKDVLKHVLETRIILVG